MRGMAFGKESQDKALCEEWLCKVFRGIYRMFCRGRSFWCSRGEKRMRKVLSEEEKYKQMMEEPVQSLIPRLAVPSMVSMIVVAVYNMADTFFVSRLGTSASAAVGVVYSMVAIIQAIAFMIGMGSGNEISRLLGAKKQEEAEHYVAIGFFTELILGTFIALFCIIYVRILVYALGSTKTIAPYAISYAQYVLLGTPFIMASLGMNNMLRFQGNSFYSMLGIATGGILNMFLDPLFIYGFHMGIIGAAVATTLSQIVSFSILLYQCNKMPACISVSLKNFKPSLKRYSLILQFGLPSLARQGVAGVSTIILNFSAHPYGDAAIAAMAIVMRIIMFLNSLVIGFGQGFQPVCGYCYGAKNYKRVEEAYRFSLKVCFLMLIVMGTVVFIFAKPLITVFRKEDAEVIRIGYLALRLQCLTIPLAAQITMANMFSQTTGYPFRASIVALLRQGICLIPVLFILPPLFGLLGVQMSQPISDIFSAGIAFFITNGILRELRVQSGK